MDTKPGTITLMGSGELAETMAKVHRLLLSRVDPPVNAVFVDTPAGFEVNADEISAKAVEYFRQRFSVPLAVASFKSATRATDDEIESAVRTITRSNYIFSGPGSPTYAARNWNHSPVWEAITRRLDEGAALVFASAAAIAVSHFALPVYEIYKAGEELRWCDGLNILGRIGLDVIVIPHWNNAEGGKYDTRFCFMGEERFRALVKLLPEFSVVLGIDEYTACIINLETRSCEIVGVGGVTIRRKEHEQIFPSGATFDLDHLRGDAMPTLSFLPSATTDKKKSMHFLQTRIESARRVFGVSDSQWNIADAARALYELANEVEHARDAGVEKESLAQAVATMRELGIAFFERASGGSADLANVTPLVDLLVELRNQLRAEKQFALADRVRTGLADLGIVIEDSPAGTRWRKAEKK